MKIVNSVRNLRTNYNIVQKYKAIMALNMTSQFASLDMAIRSQGEAVPANLVQLQSIIGSILGTPPTGVVRTLATGVMPLPTPHTVGLGHERDAKNGACVVKMGAIKPRKQH